jgi:hypothetical protein
MKESSPLRRWLLAVALAATVAAAGWVGGNQEESRVALVATGEDARPARASEPDARAVAGEPREGGEIDLEKLKQRPVATDFGEMFPARQPELPPEMKRKPEPPRAPPLPFQFFGRMVENGTTMVFLNRQDDVFAVKAGDTIGNTYRVEEINGSEIVLTYLPLKQRQTLPIGSIQ